ncbi:LysR substrate-binding domain-containing protein [Roseibacterium sp. SDUM158017]|uniref:LysR substrate-binding domain-containing protein n=1 Tax=Roseicyclus salinarum TaxID=3036773 RepID=UPI002414D7FF|nr:LysR substrate-binding domain-containing protein [Roseibacterium sp. SDUM158017]MDG4649578.1 LysR substrate-binding domain-containing protein [Roseibacterium sp. SDUM158017]
MPSLQQLRYLALLSETLHFRRAAERANVTQPTLSAQLSALEEKLGVQLAERSRSRVVMTAEGEEIAARARRILAEVDEIVEIARRGGKPLGGTIRVGVVQSLGSYFLPLVIPDLHAGYPDLRLYVREGLASDLMGRLEAGSLDLLFLPLPAAGAELSMARLFREPLLAVAANDHPIAALDRVPRDRLSGERILTLETGHRLHDQVRRICEETGAEISLDYGATSLDTIRQMVAMGLGISLLPALYVRSEVRPNQLVTARPLEGPQPFRAVGMVWRARAARGAEYQELAQAIRRILRSTTPEVTVVD